MVSTSHFWKTLGQNDSDGGPVIRPCHRDHWSVPEFLTHRTFCVYICMYICIYDICMCILVYVYIYIHTYTYTCMLVCISIYVYICRYIDIGITYSVSETWPPSCGQLWKAKQLELLTSLVRALQELAEPNVLALLGGFLQGYPQFSGWFHGKIPIYKWMFFFFFLIGNPISGNHRRYPSASSFFFCVADSWKTNWRFT